MTDYRTGEKLYVVCEGMTGKRVIGTIFIGVRHDTGRFVTMSPRGAVYHGYTAERYFKLEADALATIKAT